MRRIEKDEPCLSATEIAQRFRALSGVELHPTNVGNAARRLELDYLEASFPESVDRTWNKPQRLYAEADMPRIFTLLWELADGRAKYDHLSRVKRGLDGVEHGCRAGLRSNGNDRQFEDGRD